MSTLFFEDIVHWINANNTWIQIISLVAGIIYILMQIFQHKWMWYFCIATALTALAIAVTNQNGSDWAPLWAQVGLNLYLLVISVIGIGRWRQLESESKGQIHIVKLTRKRMLTVAVVIAAGAPLLAWILSLTSDPAPLVDAISLVLSLVAAWLLSQSHIEEWLFWIAADVFVVAVYAGQSKWFMVALYSFYIVACIIGFLNWKKNGVTVE